MTIETEAPDSKAQACEAKSKKPSKRAQRARKPKATKQAKPAAKSAKSAAERTNKRAEVIAMMKRAKGATLAEIVEATGWQKHTGRGFVSILGSNGGQKVESSKSAAGPQVYKSAK